MPQTSEIFQISYEISYLEATMQFSFYSIKFSKCIMIFLMILQRFLTPLRKFPMIFQNLSQGEVNLSGHFLKISKHFGRLQKSTHNISFIKLIQGYQTFYLTLNHFLLFFLIIALLVFIIDDAEYVLISTLSFLCSCTCI